MNFKMKAIAAGVLLAMAGGANAAIVAGNTSPGNGELFLNVYNSVSGNSFAFDTNITATAFINMDATQRAAALNFNFGSDADWATFNNNTNLVWNFYAANNGLATSDTGHWGVISTVNGATPLATSVAGISTIGGKIGTQANGINAVGGDAANADTYFIPAGNAAGYATYGSKFQSSTSGSNEYNVNDWASLVWLGRTASGPGAALKSTDLGFVQLSQAGQLIYSATGPSAVPVPAAVWLLGSALLGLVGVGSRRNRGMAEVVA